MRRKAGNKISEYMREKRLANNRANPIGQGVYGTVYESDITGNVIKQLQQDYVDPQTGLGIVNEADLQSLLLIWALLLKLPVSKRSPVVLVIALRWKTFVVILNLL